MRLGILGSTRGTDMEALVSAIQAGKLDAEIALVLSDNHDAFILQRAAQHNIPQLFIDPQDFTSKAFDTKITKELTAAKVELVILIGFKRILGKRFITTWKNKIINVHPSLLPDFAGQMDENVHRSVLASGITETGCTVHFVTEALDAGPIIIQKKCEVKPDDTIKTLKDRVQSLEGEALVESILFIQNRKQNASRKNQN